MALQIRGEDGTHRVIRTMLEEELPVGDLVCCSEEREWSIRDTLRRARARSMHRNIAENVCRALPGSDRFKLIEHAKMSRRIIAIRRLSVKKLNTAFLGK